METRGTRYARMREGLHISQEQLSEFVGCSKLDIDNFEKGINDDEEFATVYYYGFHQLFFEMQESQMVLCSYKDEEITIYFTDDVYFIDCDVLKDLFELDVEDNTMFSVEELISILREPHSIKKKINFAYFLSAFIKKFYPESYSLHQELKDCVSQYCMGYVKDNDSNVLKDVKGENIYDGSDESRVYYKYYYKNKQALNDIKFKGERV